MGAAGVKEFSGSGVDKDGWQYAVDFPSQYHSSNSVLYSVRRQRWVRRYEANAEMKASMAKEAAQVLRHVLVSITHFRLLELLPFCLLKLCFPSAFAQLAMPLPQSRNSMSFDKIPSEASSHSNAPQREVPCPPVIHNA